MSGYKVDVKGTHSADARLLETLRRTAIATLEHCSADSPSRLTLMLGDDLMVQRLNQQFRQQNKTTDVLSFPDGEAPSRGMPIYLGDVIFSVPQAKRQAAQGNHALSAELQLLTVHGVLHLLGYDHTTSAEKEQMWAVQTEILTKINAPVVAPPLEYDE